MMIKSLFKTTTLLALAAALTVAGLPLHRVAAAGPDDPNHPPSGELTNERLERIWARQLRAYEKWGKSEEFVEKAQALIDRASTNGRDVSAVQSALDAFENAIKDARPIYESANGIVNSHQGFDADGKVTDPEKAKETVHQLGEKMKEIRDAMGGTGQALRESIRAFREANPRPERTTP
jgi:hypothetical protein